MLHDLTGCALHEQTYSTLYGVRRKLRNSRGGAGFGRGDAGFPGAPVAPLVVVIIFYLAECDPHLRVPGSLPKKLGGPPVCASGDWRYCCFQHIIENAEWRISSTRGCAVRCAYQLSANVDTRMSSHRRLLYEI